MHTAPDVFAMARPVQNINPPEGLPSHPLEAFE